MHSLWQFFSSIWSSLVTNRRVRSTRLQVHWKFSTQEAIFTTVFLLDIFCKSSIFEANKFIFLASDAGLLSREVIYAGLSAKMAETMVSSITQTLAEPQIDDLFLNKNYENPKSFDEVISKSVKQFSIQATGIICSRPFCVIAIR